MKTWQKLKKNPKLWQKFFIREKIIQSIREFFFREKFHEVETPLLLPSVVPESYLEVFETYLLDRQRKKRRMFLATSPEASIKKLLVAGIGNCFEITKSFRNTETGSNLHNPEFTILEWYRVGADYKDVMRDCERLILHIYESIFRHAEFSSASNTKRKKILKQVQDDKMIKYQGNSIDLSSPWERISVPEALQKYAHISFDEITNKSGEMFSKEKVAQVAKEKGYRVEKKNSWEEIFNQIFLNEVEPHLGTHGKPTIIYDYPRPMAALSKIKETDPRLAERFEFYIAGLELGDCYTELTDYNEQKKRFAEEQKIRKIKEKTSVYPDEDFLEALKAGMPKCSGIAVGIDRLVMLFADTTNVADTLFFPLSEFTP
ncbi:EF-P lysine aminoacylase GenX [Candidatus Gottesmanbacteria bacterium]|nr:EF-P lysine aminoacylase GenX [Candidatus Gottesmanbacteria bacterium]